MNILHHFYLYCINYKLEDILDITDRQYTPCIFGNDLRSIHRDDGVINGIKVARLIMSYEG